MKKTTFLFLVLTLVFYNTKAQNPTLDSLKKILATNPNDTTKIKLLAQLSEATENINEIILYTKPAIELGEKKLTDKKLSKVELIHYKRFLAMAYNNTGFMHGYSGNTEEALNNLYKGLSLQEDIKDNESVVYTLINIATIYHNQNEHYNNSKKESMLNKALEYYTKALKICREIKDEETESRCLNNIGLVYDDLGNKNKALEFYNQSLKISSRINFKEGMGTSYNNIGYIYQTHPLLKTDKKDSVLNIATDAFYKALQEFDDINYDVGKINVYVNLGLIQLELKHTNEAKKYANNALELAEKLGYPEQLKRAYYLNYKVYYSLNDGINALKMYEKHILFRDSLNNEQTKSISLKNQLKYDYELRENKIKSEKEKIELKAIEDKKRQNIIISGVLLGLVVVSVFSISIYRALQKNKKANIIITQQKKEVEHQKHELEEKQREIIESITYAKRLQEAILPPQKLVKEYLKNSFILYKPKDIVAGDFYFMEPVDNGVIFAAADCTGHGVPGAMVSVVCSNALNRTVKEFGILEPNLILNKVRELVIETFERSESEVKDGMDISLCYLNYKSLELHWAGANNPLWLIKNNELLEIKADKMPIGKYSEQKSFTNQIINLNSGDTIYIFTDGYADQFGGEKGKKFKYKPFAEKLISIQNLDLEKQREIINNTFEDWKGDLEQVDDVCVIGVRI